MKIAALTFAYNELVNLPIWRRYYGQQFGEHNLFLIDHGSDDGSTDDLGDVNRIGLPHTPFDDAKKVMCLSVIPGWSVVPLRCQWCAATAMKLSCRTQELLRPDRLYCADGGRLCYLLRHKRITHYRQRAAY